LEGSEESRRSQLRSRLFDGQFANFLNVVDPHNVNVMPFLAHSEHWLVLHLSNFVSHVAVDKLRKREHSPIIQDRGHAYTFHNLSVKLHAFSPVSLDVVSGFFEYLRPICQSGSSELGSVSSQQAIMMCGERDFWTKTCCRFNLQHLIRFIV
jgi:hypothetical protein